MRFLIEMLRQGGWLLGHDPTLPRLITNTLHLAIESTLIALVIGLPISYWLAMRTNPLTRAGRTIANACLGLPPVGVGIYVLLLLFSHPPPLGTAHWFSDSMHDMVFVQTILAIPIMIALPSAAILRLPPGLIEQARGFGAKRLRLFAFTLREAKLGILTALIVSMGSAIGEVGATTVLVDPSNPDATLAMRILNDSSMGATPTGTPLDISYRVEHSLAILGMLLCLGAVLTIAQRWRGSPWRRLRTTGDRRQSVDVVLTRPGS